MEELKNVRYEIIGDKDSMDRLEEVLSRDEILETKEKKGKVVTRDLKVRLLGFTRNGDAISLDIENMSPNSYLEIAGIKQQDVVIKRMGYIK